MRREVRVDNRFFDDADAAFRSERGPNGEPSADDFIRIDLFGIQEEVAERFDDLPLESTAPGIRVLVLSGLMFRQAAVYAAEMPDGIVYLIGLEVDHYQSRFDVISFRVEGLWAETLFSVAPDLRALEALPSRLRSTWNAAFSPG